MNEIFSGNLIQKELSNVYTKQKKVILIKRT